MEHSGGVALLLREPPAGVVLAKYALIDAPAGVCAGDEARPDDAASPPLAHWPPARRPRALAAATDAVN